MTNKKQNLNNSSCNDFEYETLLKSEGEKINKAKHDFQPPSKDFQESLKMEILEKRQGKFNTMKKIFEVLTIPLQPKYSISVLTIAWHAWNVARTDPVQTLKCE